MSSLQRDLMRRQLGPGLPPLPAVRQAGGALARRAQKDYSPVSWESYFESFRDVVLPKQSHDTFRVYLSGFQEDADYGNKPLLLLLHGAGYSGLTWALFVKNLVSLCYCKIAAIDLRGHGSSHSSNDDDLSADTLARDVANVYRELVGDVEDEPSVILVGHSMGGAIAAHCANKCQESLASLVGLIVIDVVEGTALDALQGMQSVLRSRPTEFPSLQNAIEWSVRSGQTRNLEAARVSMPGQLKSKTTAESAAVNVVDVPLDNQSAPSTRIDEIVEENEDDDADVSTAAQPTSSSTAADFKAPEQSRLTETFVWRINLTKSEPFWKGWFEGLSNLFLTAPTQAKMLLLAGVDRLDKTLTVGQMQGKFQMQVLPQCGHAVHEDVPDKVAEVVATFLIRNRLTQAKSDFQPTFPAC